MSVLRRAKLRTPDGTESIEYPLGVEAENVEVANQENLSQRLVRIDEDLEKNEEDIAAVTELAGTNKQNIGAAEVRIDALERRNASAANINLNNGYNVQETIGNINVNTDGNISEQLNSLSKYDLSLPSSELRINQLLGVLKSYYDNRLDGNGNAVFEYGHTTALDEEYSNTGPHKREIDCSTFIGLGLRGITFDSSPYSVLSSNESDGSDSGNDDDSEQVTPETDDSVTNHTNDIVIGDYPWAIDLAKYKRKLVTELKSVRSASQLCQLLEESGWKIEIADDFSNIRRGDIIFYAKKNGNEWVQPNRYKHISHVAIVSSVLDNSGDAYSIGAQYPYKHTMYEVSTFGNIVLNTCLEKRTINRIAVVCRPKLGCDDYYVSGGASRIQGIGSNVNKMSKPGFMYLTSSTTTGLPTELNNGLGYALKVDVSYNYWGKYYSLVQTLYNTRGTDMYIRTQYCYNNNYQFSSSRWNDWAKISTETSTNNT